MHNRIENINNIDNVLKQIVNEKDKLEKLTKKVINTKHSNQRVKNNTIKNNKNNKKDTKIDETLIDNKEFDDLELTKISPETGEKILELLKNYVNMDKSFRVKHESLKTLYNAYLTLYKKYKDSTQENTQTNTYASTQTNTNTISNPQEHQEILKNIHSEMKDNNSNLYKERIMILKKNKRNTRYSSGNER